MGEVAQLGVVPIDRTGGPQQSVIDYIETLLARARTGELQSIAAVYVNANGWPSFAIEWGQRAEDCYPMGTGMILMQSEFVRDMEDRSRPAPPPALPDPA